MYSVTRQTLLSADVKTCPVACITWWTSPRLVCEFHTASTNAQGLGMRLVTYTHLSSNTFYATQRQCRWSSWSGLGRTTFQRVIGLVFRLHQHPGVAKYTCVYDVQLLAIWRILLLAVVLLLSVALRVAPAFPVSKTTVWKEERCVQVFLAKLVWFLDVVALQWTSPLPPCTVHEWSFISTFEMLAPPLVRIIQFYVRYLILEVYDKHVSMSCNVCTTMETLGFRNPTALGCRPQIHFWFVAFCCLLKKVHNCC